jgi:hypothetical protein
MGTGQAQLALEWPSGSYARYKDYFGQYVLATIPVQWWSPEWHQGLRRKVMVGRVVSHHVTGEAEVCVEPPVAEQGWEGHGPRCVPLRDDIKLEILTRQQYLGWKQ